MVGFTGVNCKIPFTYWNTVLIKCYGRDTLNKTSYSPPQAPVGFPGGSVVNNLPVNIGYIGYASSVPESGRSPEGGNGNPLQSSGLENPMHRAAWQSTVYGVTKNQMQLSMHACT